MIGANPLKVAAVLPAYNEENRICAVLRALAAAPDVDEIVVVSDGSTDKTFEVASAFAAQSPKVRAIQLARNKGKGGAMREGALLTDADVLIFFDADLVGLTPQHIHDLLQPVCAGEATMAMGIFQGGRWATDIAQRFSPGITGQRAIRRDVFLQIPDLDSVGYGIEMAITDYVRRQGLTDTNVVLRGITHPMKEEKLGWTRGAVSRAHMYAQMTRFRWSHGWFSRPPRVRKTIARKQKKRAPPQEERAGE